MLGCCRSAKHVSLEANDVFSYVKVELVKTVLRFAMKYNLKGLSLLSNVVCCRSAGINTQVLHHNISLTALISSCHVSNA